MRRYLSRKRGIRPIEARPPASDRRDPTPDADEDSGRARAGRTIAGGSRRLRNGRRGRAPPNTSEPAPRLPAQVHEVCDFAQFNCSVAVLLVFVWLTLAKNQLVPLAPPAPVSVLLFVLALSKTVVPQTSLSAPAASPTR